VSARVPGRGESTCASASPAERAGPVGGQHGGDQQDRRQSYGNGPCLLSSSGAVTAFTIDRISRPAVATAVAAIAEESNRRL